MSSDTLKKRYIAKLLNNLIGFAISLITQAIIPRGLGPKAYGDFSFLYNFFNQVVGFFDMGSSTCFYTKLSQRQKEFGLVSFYFLFICSVSFLLFIIMFFIRFTSMPTIIWPDQKLFYIYLAAVLGLLTWIIQVLNSMTDAYGVTVSAELSKILQKVFGLALILALFFMNRLTLTNFFFYHYSILIFLIVAFILVLEWNGYSIRQKWYLPLSQIKMYAKEFYYYCNPLFVVSFIALIAGILDRWILQKFSGSVEQGFYGLSYQIGAICFIFTSAMTPLIMREFSIAFKNNDLTEMASLFRRFVPMLYTIAAYFTCFLAVEGHKVTIIIGGENFHQAALVVSIMAFYPIHQTYGQLTASVFFAAGHTALYRNIGIPVVVFGLPVTYFLLAPTGKMGLNLGATGLAIKMVVLNIIGVNIQLYFVARFLKLRVWRYYGHQLASVACLLGIAFITGKIVDSALEFYGNVIVNFVTSGIVYTIIVVGFVMAFPVVIRLTRDDIRTGIKNLKSSYNSIFNG